MAIISRSQFQKAKCVRSVLKEYVYRQLLFNAILFKVTEKENYHLSKIPACLSLMGCKAMNQVSHTSYMNVTYSSNFFRDKKFVF